MHKGKVASILPGFLVFLSMGALVMAIISGNWERQASLPIASGELIGVVWDGRPVVTGGLGPAWQVSARVYVYEPSIDRWERLPDLPVPLNHHAAAVVEDVLYVMGGAAEFGSGMQDRAEVYALTPGATEWGERAPMPEARWGHGAAVVDGRIYVVGGRQSEDRALLIYDPQVDQWELGPDVPTPRDHLGVVALDGLLYTIGGRVGLENVGNVEVFDPQAHTWTSLIPLPTARSGMAVAVVNGRIHTAGGEDLQTGEVFDTHEVYDPEAQEWIAAPPLLQATHGAAGFALDAGFLVVGGSSEAGGRSALGWLDRADLFISLQND